MTSARWHLVKRTLKCVSRLRRIINGLRPQRNCRDSADIFKCIFLKENEFRLKGINWISTGSCLVLTRRQLEGNYGREPMVTQFTDIYMCIYIYMCVCHRSWNNGMCCRSLSIFYCPASRTTLVATRFRVAVICPIIQVPHCIRVFFYFVWFVFINHIFQFYYELCTYCNILDIYLS